MISLALTLVVIIILLIAFALIIRNKPDLWFWIFLNLYFDPGGYVSEFLGGTLLGPLHISDVFISGMVLCMMFSNINWNVIFQDQFLRNFLLYLIIFTLYYFIVYGGIVPYYQNDFDYPTFLMKNRLFIYGFIILFSVYVFSLRGLYYFYTATLSVGVICLSLYFITLSTGIGLIPVSESARNPGDDIMRITMISYGIFYIVFPISVITYLISRKINLSLKYKNWLYYGGVVMTITLLITLTRRIQIDIIGTIIIIAVIISYLFRTGKISSILNIVIPAILVTVVLFFTFPKYAGYIAEVAEDTILLITTGRDSKGESDQRVSGDKDYKLVKEYIGNNLFFGTGYTNLYWKDGRAHSARGEEFAVARDAAGEVPIYRLFFDFGIAGAILMFPLYFIMGSLFFKLIYLLRLKLFNYLQDPLVVIISIYVLLSIAIKFTTRLYALSADFMAPVIGGTAILMGLGFALYHKIWLDAYAESK